VIEQIELIMYNLLVGSNYFIILLSLLAITIMIVRLAKYLAIRANVFIDIPNQRSLHSKPVPRCGGIVLFLVFMAGTLVITGWNLPFALPYLLGGVLIFLVGLMDDLINLKGKLKIIGMVSSAILPMILGLKLNCLAYFGCHPLLVYPLTAVWIYGMINAFNFMDGIDGLVGGYASIGAFFVLAIAVLSGNSFVPGIALIMLSACLGFLVYNFNPASIFLGDAGSMFLGYNFALLGIILNNSSVNSVPIYVFLFIFAPIIYDSMVTFIRRGLQGKNVIEAHREHLYQRLIILGMSHRDVSLIYYVLGLLFGIMGLVFLTSSLAGKTILFLLGLAIIITFSLLVKKLELSAKR
jgi:UDP-GlcNAc:undecaprenyl-phosphate GlcNAc-1-phosphate transferase